MEADITSTSSESSASSTSSVSDSSSESATHQAYPASLIKLAVFNDMAIDPMTGMVRRDPELKLAADEYRRHRRFVRLKAKRRKAEAKAALARREYEESRLLLAASEKGMHFTSYDFSTAVQVAAAARDTLKAEEEYVLSSLENCESRLADLQDSLEEVRARLLDATLQYDYFCSKSNAS